MQVTDALDGKQATEIKVEQEYLKQTCTRCPLSQSRKNIVWGAGNRNARILVFDQQAGPVEDDQGLPFEGQWGDLMEKIWKEVGLKRSDLFLTLMTRCRPPGDRSPEGREIDACRPFLVREIMEVQPQVVVAFDFMAHEPLKNRIYKGPLYPSVRPYRITGEGPDIVFAMVTALHPKVWLDTPEGPERDLVFEHIISDWQMIARMTAPVAALI